MTNVYHRDARNILVRKDLLSSSPTPVSTQGELQQVTQDHSQSGFDHLQGWRLKNLSTHFMLCLVNLTVNKKCFCFAWLVLILIMIFFLICIRCLLFFTGQKNVAPSSPLSPSSYLYTLIRSSRPLLFRLKSPSS